MKQAAILSHGQTWDLASLGDQSLLLTAPSCGCDGPFRDRCERCGLSAHVRSCFIDLIAPPKENIEAIERVLEFAAAPDVLTLTIVSCDVWEQVQMVAAKWWLG